MLFALIRFCISFFSFQSHFDNIYFSSNRTISFCWMDSLHKVFVRVFHSVLTNMISNLCKVIFPSYVTKVSIKTFLRSHRWIISDIEIVECQLKNKYTLFTMDGIRFNSLQRIEKNWFCLSLFLILHYKIHYIELLINRWQEQMINTFKTVNIMFKTVHTISSEKGFFARALCRWYCFCFQSEREE